MSVVIRGMKIPNTCWECAIESGQIDIVSTCLGAACPICTRDVPLEEFNMHNGRHPECPMSELKPHGRLIDADTLKVESGWIAEAENAMTHITFVYANDIVCSPTVIEAEEGK